MSRSKELHRHVSSVSASVGAKGFSDPDVSETFRLEFIPGRFAVVVYDGPRISAVDREFLPWKEARERARHLTRLHLNSDHWVAAVPQPISRATFAASSESRSA